jgi:hypothetical protein
MSTFEVPLVLLISSLLLVGVNAFGQPVETNRTKTPPSSLPPRVVAAPPVSQVSTQTYVYDQKPVAGPAAIVSPEQAQSIIDKFKTAFPKLGSPRMLIYVNRSLVDQDSGIRLIARNEKTDSNGDRKTAKTTAENRYRNTEKKEAPLADRQTVRDVERLFGRPLRMAGVKLADQPLATQLMTDHPFQPLNTEGEQARKDREALSKIADVVVEVLISSKNIQVPEISGARTATIPDIQATAMRLKDSEILGQSSSSDVLRDRTPRDVREVAEATALALMEDMLTGTDGK